MVGFVKVPHVRRVRGPAAWIKGQGGIAADQDGDGAHPAGGSGRSPRVGGNVGGHNNGVSAVPAVRLAPQKGIQECGRATVAGIDDRGTFHVRVVGEQVHEDRLGGLGLVHEGLRPDF
jgi:hypothetical protein